MKLELKHIQTYPLGKDGIKVMNGFNEERIITSIDIELEQVYIQYEAHDLSSFKLILRPLSDLTKEIEHNGEKFKPFEKLLEGHIKDGKHYRDILYAIQPAKFYIMSMPYHAMQKLFEWHFDVFGLIPEGLAIDINTIKPQPNEETIKL